MIYIEIKTPRVLSMILMIIQAMSRGVTRGWVGVLMPTLGVYKNRGLGWTKQIWGGKPQHFFRYSTFCLLYLKSWWRPWL